MIYYLIDNETHEIIADGKNKFNENCLEIEDNLYKVRHGYNGSVYFENYMETDEYKEKEEEYLTQQNIKNLRNKREAICFSVINRGGLWYEKLTNSQKTELSEWYDAWLEVTETLIEPQTPSWIK